MIAYLRKPSYEMNRQPVSLLVELHVSAERYLANARPVDAFFLNTTQDALVAAMDVPGTRWSDREALLVGQPLLDEHPDWGGLALALTMPPDEPEEGE